MSKQKKQKTLSVEKRAEFGKGPSRRMREEGIVPGIFYNGAGENIPVKVQEIPLWKLYDVVGSNRVFYLTIDENGDSKERPSIIWGIRFHPFKNKIIHVDFYGVNLKKKLHIDVPVEVTGHAPGSEEGGVLEIFRDTIQVSCLPLNIPDSIVLDASNLNVNDTVNIDEIEFPEGVEPLYEENFAVIGVTVPSMEIEEEEEGEEVEGEEGEEAEGEEAEGEEE